MTRAVKVSVHVSTCVSGSNRAARYDFSWRALTKSICYVGPLNLLLSHWQNIWKELLQVVAFTIVISQGLSVRLPHFSHMSPAMCLFIHNAFVLKGCPVQFHKMEPPWKHTRKEYLQITIGRSVQKIQFLDIKSCLEPMRSEVKNEKKPDPVWPGDSNLPRAVWHGRWSPSSFSC